MRRHDTRISYTGPFEVLAGAKTALELAKLLIGVARNLERQRANNPIACWIDEKTHGDVGGLVLGLGGAGKTRLSDLLVGKSRLKDHQDYNPDPTQDIVPISPCRSLTVAAGQDKLFKEWEGLTKAVANCRRALIVNVLSWGHHTPFAHKTRSFHELARNNGLTVSSADEFRAKYVQLKQEEEFAATHDIVRYWPPNVRAKLVFINVVTKADFWWDDRETVYEYYSGARSPFALIENELRAKTRDLIYYPILPVSLGVGDVLDVNKNPIFLSNIEVVVQQQLLANSVLSIVRSELFRKSWKIPREQGIELARNGRGA